MRWSESHFSAKRSPRKADTTSTTFTSSDRSSPKPRPLRMRLTSRQKGCRSDGGHCIRTDGAGAQDSMGNAIRDSMMPVGRYVFDHWPELGCTHIHAEVGAWLMAKRIEIVP